MVVQTYKLGAQRKEEKGGTGAGEGSGARARVALPVRAPTGLLRAGPEPLKQGGKTKSTQRQAHGLLRAGPWASAYRIFRVECDWRYRYSVFYNVDR